MNSSHLSSFTKLQYPTSHPQQSYRLERSSIIIKTIKMPYMSIIIPQVSNEHKEKLLGAWPTISKEINALPSVLGVTGALIVAQDGAAVTDFKFVQTMGSFFYFNFLCFL